MSIVVLVRPEAEAKPSRVDYAGFWRRFFAALIDQMILSIAALVISAIFHVSAGGGFDLDGDTDLMGGLGLSVGWNHLTSSLVQVLVTFMYSTGFIGSRWGATPGMRALDIEVVTDKFQGLSYGKAATRFLWSLISGAIFGLGYLMICFTERRQSFHDKMAGTVVIRR